MRTSASAWISATRPQTLPAALAPIGLGVALAAQDGFFRPAIAAATLLTALLLQIASNLANDYFDFRQGADGPDRLGPTRACQSGALRPRQVATATMVTVFLAVVMGLYLLTHGGWLLAGLGLAAVVAAIAYTGGSKPLGYLGLGDALVFVFFGPVAVIGTYWLQAGSVSAGAIVGSIVMGSLIAAILVVNNLRDRVTDARVGKRTLAVRLGARFSRLQYAALIAIGIVLPAAAATMGFVAPGWAASLLLGPVAGALTIQVARRDGRDLNPLLGATALFALAMAALLAVAGGFV